MVIDYYLCFWITLKRSGSQRSKVGSEGMVFSSSFEVEMDMVGKKGMKQG